MPPQDMHQLRFERPESQNLRRVRTRHSSSVYANALRPAWLVASRVCRRSPAARRFICGDADPPRRKSAPQKIEAEIADLERRLTRQLVNVEADDATAALRRAGRSARRRAGGRDRRTARESRRQRRPRWPTSPRCSTACQILAGVLDAAPQGELRALFDALQLDVVFHPAESAVDVAVTLYDRGSETAQPAAQVRAEDWSAPPAGLEPAHPAPEAGALSTELRGRD